MDSFEFNKITASVLVALLVAMTGSLVSDHLVRPTKLEKPVFIIEGVEAATPTGGKPTEEETLKPITPLLASANVERGQAIVKKCTQCHTFEKGAAHRTGPNLWGIIGAKVAHAADFAYSSGFKDKGGTWDDEKMNILLHKPRAFVSATKMSFVGLKDPQERADVIAYLHTLSDTPVPLPTSASSSTPSK
jgi:cytochrome c